MKPDRFLCCRLLGSCILWRTSIDISTDASVVTRSTFDRYSTDTRPTSNQCHYRYSVNLATDMYISTLKWGLVDFPKNLHTKPVCRLWIIQERLALQPFQIWYLSHRSMQNQVISGKEHLECCFAKKLFTCYRIFLVKILRRKHEKDLKIVSAKVR